MIIRPFKQISYDIMEAYFKGCFTTRRMREGDYVLTQYGRTFLLTILESPGQCQTRGPMWTCGVNTCVAPKFKALGCGHCPRYAYEPGHKYEGQVYIMCKVLKDIELFKEAYATLLATGLIEVDNVCPKGWIVEI